MKRIPSSSISSCYFLCLFYFCSFSAWAEKLPTAAIASAHPLATEAGLQMLQQGGNAFDAAIAVTAVLAVAEPYSSGIGGGGFYLLHQAKTGQDVMLDARERAPFKATPNMYLDKHGVIVPNASIQGALSAGIPGIPAALEWLANKHGKLKLSVSLKPAIKVARDGFKVDEHYRRMARFRKDALLASTSAAKIFLRDGQIPDVGDVIIQEDLAKTLEEMAKHGAAGFYRGAVAQQLVDAVQAAGGIWSKKDLRSYRVIEREPTRIQHHETKIVTAALPSSGGIVLAEILNILEKYPMHDLDKADQTHLIIEAMRRAYRDRAAYLGDADYVEVAQALLQDKSYAAGLAASIHRQRATQSDTLPTADVKTSGQDTTHFSIIDREGNRVAATLSINYPFGSCFVAAGTGVLLNDEMDDFSSKPGTPNAYGLVGAKANAIAGGKRMLSSMSPTFVETKDRLAVIGTPGGSRIITMVLAAILDVIDDKTAKEIVTAARLHHQYLPDKVFVEKNRLDNEQRSALLSRGHKIEVSESSWGNMQAVIWDKKTQTMSAASDPRGVGSAVVVAQ
ncbi:MAG: gamma-glutamyltransferase [Gammaproteobacteria bacterium]|nr:gamma-glutamyltransferase [Gammaproteobacteria bacterium]